MNLSQMLYEMCHDVLSATDIKAICKSRGFSEKEANSRSLFENVFLSSIGLDGAMKALTDAEVATLHLLYMENRVVDVTFFERLYGGKQAGSRAYGTFTQQFRPIFDAVQRNLIRKGVLIIGAAKTNSPQKTKMELWRYCLPPEFGPFLPPLFHPSVHSGQTGRMQADRLRADLRRLVQDRPVGPLRLDAIHLGAGGLTIGRRPFSATAVQEWRQSAWEAAILKASLQKTGLSPAEGGSRSFLPGYLPSAMHTGYLLPDNDYRPASPLPAVLYAFAQLAPDEWIAPPQLDVLLDIVYAGAGHPSSATMCQTGWDTGCLVRYQVNGQDYYRAAGAGQMPPDTAPETYLPIAEGKVFVDLDSVPYEALDLLNRLATLTIEDGRLRVLPSVAKMVDTLDSLRDHAVLRYLGAHSPEFRAILKEMDAQWGKLIIHENLLVARVSDLSLRVKLQQAFASTGGAPSVQLVSLSGDYIAFPRALLGEVEKLVKKAGHVIKTVQAT